jgi:hypothetical protein
LLCTEWNEFKQLDMQRLKAKMARPILIDGRNIYDPVQMQEMGFFYRGVARGLQANDNIVIGKRANGEGTRRNGATPLKTNGNGIHAPGSTGEDISQAKSIVNVS